MQNVTVPYVIFSVTRSAGWVGFAAFAQIFPAVLLGPVAGWLADHLDRRRFLLAGQITQGLLGAALWLAWALGQRSPAVVLSLVALNGVAFGLTMPAWQALINDLVPRKDLLNAITLNSAQFNAGRAIGPALAGIVLARFGPSVAFLVNAVSFLGVIVALASVSSPTAERPSAGSLFSGLRDGLAYLRGHRQLRVAIGLIGAVFFLGQPVFQLVAVFSRRVYDVGPGRYGLLAAMYGIGAVLGGVLLGSLGNGRSRSRIVVNAFGAYALSLAGFALSPTYWFGLVCLFAAGAAFLISVATINTSVHMIVSEQMRGRVMAFYGMTITGFYPLGALLQGMAADRIGAPATVLAAAGALFCVWLVLRARPAIPGALDGEGLQSGAPLNAAA